VSADSEKSFLEQVYLDEGLPDNPFFHQFRAKNGDNPVENWLLWWIRCGQPVDNPLIALLERAKREEEKREKILCTAS
jgi:hypothetical protein